MVAAVRAASAQAPPTPNIIIILADDLGYGDLGRVRPPVDQDAAPRRDGSAGAEVDELLRAAGLLAEPRRAADRTPAGEERACSATGRPGTAPKVLRDNAAQGLPADEITIAELLKTRGYATGMVASGILGHLPAFPADASGLDSWFGLPFSHDMKMTLPRDHGYQTKAYYEPKPEYWDVALMRNGDVIERPADHRTLTRRYTEEAVRFIEASKDRPFFLYFAHSLPHIPLARSADFVGHSAGGIYGDVVEEIDWSTGRVLDALRAAGIDRQTLVVFTSDNGPWLPYKTHGGSAGPLREGKGTTWEGGVRTPAILLVARHRASIRRDRHGIGDGPLRHRREARRRGTAGDRTIDGVDLRAPLTGTGKSLRQMLFYYWDSELRAVRKGAYKAHFITSGAYGEGDPRVEHDPPLLFNLAEDPGERHNIAAAHPDIVADLTREAAAHRKTVAPVKPLFDELLPAPARP
jgi:arylsulfatase A-like enzyme